MKPTNDPDSYIESLEIENHYLKSLLDGAGIPYDVSQAEDFVKIEPYDLNQGARILPRAITKDDANKFYDRFWGRLDVYAKRSVNKTTGKVSYFPQCSNFWKSGCHRRNRDKIKCQDCAMQAYKKLEIKDIMAYLRGDSDDAIDVIGVYPLFPDDAGSSS